MVLCSAPSSASGLIQMACSAGPQREPGQSRMAHPRGRRPRRADRLPAGAVPLAVFLPRGKRRASSTWPSRFPGPPPRASRGWRASSQVVIVGSIFERRAAGVYHNTAAGHRRRWRRCWASTARCTSPTIRCISRSITSRPATWASAASTRATRASRRWCAGTSGIRKPRAWRRWAARRCCFIPPPSAGIPAEKARVRRGAARRLAHHPARARHRQRRSTWPR